MLIINHCSPEPCNNLTNHHTAIVCGFSNHIRDCEGVASPATNGGNCLIHCIDSCVTGVPYVAYFGGDYYWHVYLIVVGTDHHFITRPVHDFQIG